MKKSYTSINIPDYDKNYELVFYFCTELGELDKPVIIRKFFIETENISLKDVLIKIEDATIYIPKNGIGSGSWTKKAIEFSKKIENSNVSITKFGKHKLRSQTVYGKDTGKIFEWGY